MKKVVLTLMLTVAMVLTMSATVFAELGSFVESPSANQAPELVSSSNSSEECEADIVITSYGDRHLLDEEGRNEIESAYNTIVNAQDMADLNGAFGELAEQLGVSSSDFAVSDLFDMSSTDCDSHDEHGAFSVTVKPAMLENFMGLMCFDDGEWKIIDGAKVSEDGEHIEFETEMFGPFAIVVYTGEGEITLPSGTNIIPIVAGAAVAAVAAAGAVFFVMFKKKKKREADLAAE